MNRDWIRIVEPDILFDQSITIDHGRLTCQVNRVGGQHSIELYYMYVNEDQTLFRGDPWVPLSMEDRSSNTSHPFSALVEASLPV